MATLARCSVLTRRLAPHIDRTLISRNHLPLALLSPSLQESQPGGGTARSIRHFQSCSRTTRQNFHTGKERRLPFQDDSPGSKAFADCETPALTDLFYDIAKEHGNVDEQGHYLCMEGVKQLLASVGEHPDDETLEALFRAVNLKQDGKLHLPCFLQGADLVLGDAPARIVLIVGGPGSGKGVLCRRLEAECNVVHMSCGDLLREEVEMDTPLGRECAEIMARGDLVSSAVVTALIRRRMRAFPGRRVLLDGFPRSLENARDFVALCGRPELALHLDCDDATLMERIMNRARESEQSDHQNGASTARADDNIETALRRLRTYHKYHNPTMEWLRESHVPIVNLDCSGTAENVWRQLLAIGQLMRPAAKIPNVSLGETTAQTHDEDDMAWFG